jgi:hypothetical protein
MLSGASHSTRLPAEGDYNPVAGAVAALALHELAQL